MIRQKIEKLLKNTVGQEAKIERPNQTGFGDFSTNIALKTKTNPEKIIEKLKNNPLFEKIERAGPGFINFKLSKECLVEELKEILKKKENYGSLDLGRNKKVQVEFISANPTGPLTVANARGGVYGDVLANVLKKASFQVEKAYYINDCGNQILVLGHSVLKDQEAQYKGKYIDELHQRIKGDNPEKVGQLAAGRILAGIKKTVEETGISYDEWISESNLYESGRVDKVLKLLEKKNLIYNKEGAKWFKSTQFGDNRDRVVVKKDGQKTYLAGDIGFHDYKFNTKKFDKVINVWGADHHGDVGGLMAGVEALGHKGKLKIVLHQFVTLIEKGEKKRMSKRAGICVWLDDLLKEIGKDALRFFILAKSVNTHINFDLDLAKEQSKQNPVYYIQYAYARICSILKKATEHKLQISNSEFQAEELDLIRQLVKFPEIVEDTAKDYQVQRLANYALDSANSFHKFYENCRVIDQNNKVDKNRVALIEAVQTILENVLDLMGLNAPEKM